MDRKSERLVKNIEKAGIRSSLKAGHLLTRLELRNIKVQVVPNSVRIVFCILGVICAASSYYCFTLDLTGYGVLVALLSLFTFLFGIFGVRRTLSEILDSMDALQAAEILGYAAEGIAGAIGSLFDGV